jgi:hypothetical protein
MNETLSARIDRLRPELHQRAMEWIFSGAQWLTVEQIAELGAHDAIEIALAAKQWKAERRLFSIPLDGSEVFPRYAFGDDLEPLPVIKEVISALDRWDQLTIAAWFESRSWFLQGKLPRELVAKDPEQVLRAAQDVAVQLESPG